jgi:transcriptional regulator with XRE-family HTH domain
MGVNLQKNIKHYLSEKDMSVSELERNSGLKQSTVQNILHGRSKNPSIETIQLLAKEFDCSIEELIGDQEYSYNKNHRTQKLVHPEENCPWNASLFIEAVSIIDKLLKAKNITLPKSRILALVEELYRYSIGTSDKADERFAHWIVEKASSR